MPDPGWMFQALERRGVHQSRQQCTTYMSCGRARTHDHWISSQRLTLSRHTGRQSSQYGIRKNV